MTPTPTDVGLCLSCCFWLQLNEDGDTGHCRRHAPKPLTVVLNAGEVMYAGSRLVSVEWPETSPLDWCGEYKRADRS
jgi:hypothetical protein